MAIVIRHGLQNVVSGAGNDPAVNQHDATLRVGGSYDANNQSSNFALFFSLAARPGKYVLLKASSIVNFSSMSVIYSNGQHLYSRSRERLSITYPDGLTYDCLVFSVR
jgi:hypothetical protein